ncbi:unnamed protein product [Mycena citricolor]|uniref:RNA-dependent RNA polymerase n=1 Tax=Mycena citricolor TaxID=2018698 RepID=A0AAD2GYA4_9AGAR|nr:unnamed protein product [Mycena citricolor]
MVLTLRHFILKQEVFNLYRHAIRSVIQRFSVFFAVLLPQPQYLSKQSLIPQPGKKLSNGSGQILNGTATSRTFVGIQFLSDFCQERDGPEAPKQLKLGGRRISFTLGKVAVRPEAVDRTERFLYTAAVVLARRERDKRLLLDGRIGADVLQIGWLCRDNVFSVEWQADLAASGVLSVNQERREFRLTFTVTHPYELTYHVAIPFSRINSILAHSQQGSILFFDLADPPNFESSSNTSSKRTRLSFLPIGDHERLAPYISLALRIACRNAKASGLFRQLARTAAFKNVHDTELPVERRALFRQDVLQLNVRIESSVRSLLGFTNRSFDFLDEGGMQYRFEREVDYVALTRLRVGAFLIDRGLTIAGRDFEFLAYSQSELKEHAVCAPIQGHKSKAHQCCTHHHHHRASDPELTHCPARYAARISQAFTASDSTALKVDEVIYLSDMSVPSGKYHFTDGVGTMSLGLAQSIWAELRPTRRRNRRLVNNALRAVQIRFQGSKGMFSVDYKLKGHVFCLRPSMIKFSAPHSTTIEIAMTFDKPGPYYLNRPLIMLLRESWCLDRSIGTYFLSSEGLGVDYEIFKACIPADSARSTLVSGDAFYTKTLDFAIHHMLRLLKTKARIPMPAQVTLVGERPCPSMLGGGDLDGDTYHLIPQEKHPELRPSRICPPAEYAPSPQKLVARPSTSADIREFVIEYINSDAVGIVATNWLLIVDQSPHHIFDRDCLKLAKLHSDAVEYPKSGQRVAVETIPKPKSRSKTDWHAPELHANMGYQRAIGKLFRAIDLGEIQADSLSPADSVSPAERRRLRAGARPRRDIQVLTSALEQTRIEDPILHALRPIVKRHTRVGTDKGHRIFRDIAQIFSRYTSELQSICVLAHGIARASCPPLRGEGGYLTGPSIQNLISTPRERTDMLVQGVKEEQLEDDAVGWAEVLRRGWLSLELAVTERNAFGAQSFIWIALAVILKQ